MSNKRRKRVWTCAECGRQHSRDKSFPLMADWQVTLQFCSFECVGAMHVRAGLTVSGPMACYERYSIAEVFMVHHRVGGHLTAINGRFILRELSRLASFIEAHGEPSHIHMGEGMAKSSPETQNECIQRKLFTE